NAMKTKRITTKALIKAAASAAIATLLAFSQTSVKAVPVTGVFIDDPRCDNPGSQTLVDEIGNGAFFPINESIQVQSGPTTIAICVPNDGIANDWIVQMTKARNQAWQELFFVANLGATVGNADGNMIDVVNAPGVTTDAFRIDAQGIDNHQ